MNIIKKVGLTALAGSLVATSAYAGAMSVSGAAKLTYASNGEERTQGNAWSNSKGITFSGSGELDNGWNVSTSYTMTDAAFSTSNVQIDMGDAGTFSLMNGTSLAGIDKYKDVMPTAGEEVWDDVDTDDNGVVGIGNANALGYEASMMGVTLSASYLRSGVGTDNSIVVISNDLIDGMQLGYGIGTNHSTDLVEDDHSTAWIKYSAGAATVGIQKSVIDKNTGDEDRIGAAISFAVNENLSVSYGVSDVDFESASLKDEESSGLSASYTMGGMTVGAVMNKTDNVAGSSGVDRTKTEVTVAFAF